MHTEQLHLSLPWLQPTTHWQHWKKFHSHRRCQNSTREAGSNPLKELGFALLHELSHGVPGTLSHAAHSVPYLEIAASDLHHPGCIAG